MTSAGARSLILGRIRDILGERQEAPAEAHGRIARDYLASASLPVSASVDLFADRLQHYQVGVYRCRSGSLAATIGEVLASRGRRRMLVPPGLPGDWLPAAVEFVPDSALDYAVLDRSEGVLTACSLGIANTGTIVLRHGPGEGRRALTLIPDYHLCVVRQAQIVQTVPEAMRLLAAWRPALVTTISGPSATADIEMTRIRGVHGPRTLDVVIVEDW